MSKVSLKTEKLQDEAIRILESTTCLMQLSISTENTIARVKLDQQLELLKLSKDLDLKAKLLKSANHKDIVYDIDNLNQINNDSNANNNNIQQDNYNSEEEYIDYDDNDSDNFDHHDHDHAIWNDEEDNMN